MHKHTLADEIVLIAFTGIVVIEVFLIFTHLHDLRTPTGKLPGNIFMSHVGGKTDPRQIRL